ncbi:hypothetical protein AMS62_06040 [Bacillus sp. FJAT-18019]|nr:hypothetical protein AMS62_06040 [Bacillus sp. FJAT-18019]
MVIQEIGMTRTTFYRRVNKQRVINKVDINIRLIEQQSEIAWMPLPINSNIALLKVINFSIYPTLSVLENSYVLNL